jgi:hypothetical protein
MLHIYLVDVQACRFKLNADFVHSLLRTLRNTLNRRAMVDLTAHGLQVLHLTLVDTLTNAADFVPMHELRQISDFLLIRGAILGEPLRRIPFCVLSTFSVARPSRIALVGGPPTSWRVF